LDALYGEIYICEQSYIYKVPVPLLVEKSVTCYRSCLKLQYVTLVPGMLGQYLRYLLHSLCRALLCGKVFARE
jgi:hypothetical protein